MGQPLLAIVGRSNVGKSRLFNRIVGRRRAIVADSPGVTRDRHYAPAEWAGREFIAIDTGGLDLDPAADLERRISRQSLRAIEEADVVVCLFDGRVPPAAQDREIVGKLRALSKPVVFAVNKIDTPGQEDLPLVYSELGVSPLVGLSAEHGRGVDDLLEEAVRRFPPEEPEEERGASGPRVAVIGRPNVGKSTLVNRLAGEERVVAHELPGTTRDAIDVAIEVGSKRYLLVDTAGVQRRFGIAEPLQKITALSSLRTIGRADIVLLLLDAAQGLTKQDLHLAGFVREEGRGLIILANKWDLMDAPWAEYERRLRRGMGELGDLPILHISATTGKGCLSIFQAVDRLERALETRVPTSRLNRILQRALGEHHLPDHRGRAVRIAYATQTGTRPPTFALFANIPAAVPYTYRRYLMRRIQEAIGVEGVPIRLVCRKK